MLQELDNFFQFLLRFISTSDIFKSNLNIVFVITTGTALAEIHNPASAPLALLHQHKPDTYDQKHRQQRAQDRRPPGWLRRQLGFNFNITGT